MTINYTTLLGLAEPVTGTESGTWGDDVNKGITDYLDIAIAGTQTISGSQTAVTLSVTNGSSAGSNIAQAGAGASGSAQYAIINCTGNPASLLTVTVPASSRQYIVINATSTTQSVKIVGAGPTTGVTIASGEKALIAWNGSDYVKISNTSGAGVFTDITVSGTATFSGGTANGVAYLNGSKVLTTGSALTFDGTNLANTQTSASPVGLILRNDSASTSAGAKLAFQYQGTETGYVINQFDGSDFNNQYGAKRHHIWLNNATEQMRLTTTGLGIGTSSPVGRLTIQGAAGTSGINQGIGLLYSTGTQYGALGLNNSTGWPQLMARAGAGLTFHVNSDLVTTGEAMRLDTSGNLGLGVTPSAWASTWRAFEFGAGNGISSDQVSAIHVTSNAYWNGTSWIYKTSNNAANYYSQNGNHYWRTAPSGTAGNAISFTQAMTLDASGNLGLGTTSPTGVSNYGAMTINGTNGGLLDLKYGNTRSGRLVASTGSVGIECSSTNYLYFYLNGAERARIDSSGNVGIGSTPSFLLDVNGNANTGTLFAVRASGSTSSQVNIGIGVVTAGYPFIGTNTSSNPLQVGTRDATSLILVTSATERARIDSSGNLLVGTTSSSLTNSNSHIIVPNGSIYTQHISGTGSGATYYGFVYNAGVIGSITQNGTTGVLYNLTSDYRLKNNPTPVTGAKEFVMALQPKTWDWWDGSGKGVGFIAHEFMEVAKYSGMGEKDAVDENGKPVYQSIQPSSSEVMANLVSLIQEQQTLIQQLQADVAALKGQA